MTVLNLKNLAIISSIFLLVNLTPAYADELIVAFSSDTTKDEAAFILEKYNITSVSGINFSDNGARHVLVRSEGGQIKELIEALRSEEKVDEVFLNFGLRLQSQSPYPGLLQNMVDCHGFIGLNESLAYLERFVNRTPALLTFVDSGFLTRDHPFVKELASSGRILAEGDRYGIDVVSEPDKYSFYPEDMNGHGSGVASLGLAYSPNSQIFIIKVTQGNDFSFSSLLRSLDVLKKISQDSKSRIVVNMSLNTPVESIIQIYEEKGYTREEAIKEYGRLIDWLKADYINPLLDAGVIFVSAASNEGSDIEVFPGSLSDVICVGSIGSAGKDKLSDVLAPSRMRVANIDFSSLTGDPVEGTSYAAALVSAFITEILHVNPNLSTNELEMILRYNNLALGFNDAVNYLQTGELPSKPEFAPSLDFAIAARVATLCSALKDIQTGLVELDYEKLEAGITKLEIDLGKALPFSINLGDNFSEITEKIRILYPSSVVETTFSKDQQSLSFPYYSPVIVGSGSFLNDFL